MITSQRIVNVLPFKIMYVRCDLCFKSYLYLPIRFCTIYIYFQFVFVENQIVFTIKRSLSEALSNRIGKVPGF